MREMTLADLEPEQIIGMRVSYKCQCCDDICEGPITAIDRDGNAVVEVDGVACPVKINMSMPVIVGSVS